MAKIISTAASSSLDEKLNLELTYHELIYVYESMGEVIWDRMLEAFEDYTPSIPYSIAEHDSLATTLSDELKRKGFDVQ